MEKMLLSLPALTYGWRAAKTLFFLFAMLGSLLLFSAPPLFVAILDIALPSALHTAFIGPLSVKALLGHLRAFDFRASLVDLPLLSIARSLLILCAYGLCDGPGRSRGPYLGTAMLCSMASAGYVTAKAAMVGGAAGGGLVKWSSTVMEVGGKFGDGLAVEALFGSSLVLAAAHAAVAYRTSCRERRKLLVYRIDLEAVSACKSGFDYYKSYHTASDTLRVSSSSYKMLGQVC